MTTKQTIRVFPDYCSSGLWTEYANTHAEYLGIDDEGIILALKYWHWFWEWNIADSGEEGFKCRVSEYGIDMWSEDGATIVNLLNEKYGDKYNFVYDIDEWVAQ